MSMKQTVFTIENAAQCLPDLVERVHSEGEVALLVKSGRPLARIVPVLGGEEDAKGLIAFLRQWRTDHPEPDDQWGETIEESRRAVQPMKDPWE